MTAEDLRAIALRPEQRAELLAQEPTPREQRRQQRELERADRADRIKQAAAKAAKVAR